MIRIEESGDYYSIIEINSSSVIELMRFLNKYGENINGKYKFHKKFISLISKIDNNITVVRHPWDDIGTDMLLSPYPYQKEVIYHSINNPQSLLICPTGSGKTAIMIGIYTELLKNGLTDKPCLIVVKASLKYQWLNECAKFTTLSATVVETPSKKKKKFDEQFGSYNIYIANYETLKDKEVQNKLKELEIETILCDEIQYISNHKASRSKATYEFNDLKVKIGATATPITNNPQNLFGLFNFIKPDLFEKYSKFSNNYLIYRSFGQVSGIKNKEHLMNKIAPYIYIKTEEEIAGQLPELVINQIYCEMTPKMKKINELIMTDLENERLKAEELENTIKPEDMESNEEYLTSKAKIMAYQTFAQELVDEPRLLLESDSNMAKNYICKDRSPKLDILLELVEQIIDEGDKVCIFTNFERMQRIIIEEIESKLKVKCAYVNGSLDAKERYRQAYDLFKDTEEYKVLVATSAMEEGISLSECRYLIEYDLAASYASQTQRHGRVKRANSVHRTSYIYQLMCKDSWDMIAAKIIEKKEKYDTDIIKALK